MTLMEQIITIVICIVCVQFTRLLPFWIFPANRPIPEYVRYLGKVLPAAMFGIGVTFLEKKHVSFYLSRHNFLYVFSAKSLYLSEC